MNQRSARVSRVRRTIAESAACIAIQAPDASRTLPDSPWWSGWWWVMTTPWISPTPVPHAVSPSVRVSQESGSSQPVSTSTGPRSVSTTYTRVWPRGLSGMGTWTDRTPPP